MCKHRKCCASRLVKFTGSHLLETFTNLMIFATSIQNWGFKHNEFRSGNRLMTYRTKLQTRQWKEKRLFGYEIGLVMKGVTFNILEIPGDRRRENIIPIFVYRNWASERQGRRYSYIWGVNIGSVLPFKGSKPEAISILFCTWMWGASFCI